MLPQAQQEFNAWLERYGRSTCDDIIRKHLRKRVEGVADRPARIKVSLSVRRDMYAKQSGLCGICQQPMDGKNLTRLDVDHIDPSRPDFNSRQNLQLTHASCNRSKGGASVPEQAKRYGRTALDIVNTDGE
jgi:5-methylcytosine-specific restriction endonuclease McrA